MIIGFLFRAARASFALVALGSVVSGSPLERNQPPPLVLISLDGFRWDYADLYENDTPRLRQLMQDGVSARGLIPVFPSNTFPNHYSIVTGLYPSRHGIINNHMFDPGLGSFFHYNRASTSTKPEWWRGEPIWITAQKNGLISACSFWVGSETVIHGMRPTFWRAYDRAMPFTDRLEEMVGWLELPLDQRPSVITFYLEDTNDAGHRFGPNTDGIQAAVKLVDQRVGIILDRLNQTNVAFNLVIVSDHGMTSSGPDRIILLDDYLDLSTIQIDFDVSCVGLRPQPGIELTEIMTALEKLPEHATAYLAKDLPARFRIDAQEARVPPIWIVPNEGWMVVRRAAFEAAKRVRIDLGQHGYDPSLASMRGILIASGPSFRKGGDVIEAVENIHLYNLLCAALELTPAPNDGDDRLVRAMLRH